MFRTSLFISITCLLAVAFQTQSAQASCGDWLEHPGSNPASPLSIDSVRPVGFDDQSFPAGSIPSKPCNGPNCQSAPLPVAPVTFAQPKVAPDSQTLVGFVSQHRVDDVRLSYTIEDHPELDYTLVLSRIDRPPRS
ncbi:hypothetical protein LOC67_11630 [Stieleria sp. JC731]|uniref:hypothetical protein n=1 Tax=Pirellulaceae TaxID=2691357 RepID=UPI001E3482A2|nr:hypothetical protein [Stieleria sp. JC731]MCC9601197.1 hypothetical protein [Stieleria sp. JC731]